MKPRIAGRNAVEEGVHLCEENCGYMSRTSKAHQSIEA